MEIETSVYFIIFFSLHFCVFKVYLRPGSWFCSNFSDLVIWFVFFLIYWPEHVLKCSAVVMVGTMQSSIVISTYNWAVFKILVKYIKWNRTWYSGTNYNWSDPVGSKILFWISDWSSSMWNLLRRDYKLLKFHFSYFPDHNHIILMNLCYKYYFKYISGFCKR